MVRGDGRLRDDSLAVQVLRFPTPTTRATNGGTHARQAVDRLHEAGYLTDEDRDALGLGTRLNPRWVEWLMGWPVGWTSLDPLPKDKFERWEEEARAGALWKTDPATAGEVPRALQRGEICYQRRQQLICIGNGQVPSCAALAMRLLWEILK